MKTKWIFTLLCLFTVAPAIASDKGDMKANETVTLEGIVNTCEYYGPPNYGENAKTDSLERFSILQTPLSVSEQLKLQNKKTPITKKPQDTFFIQIVNLSNSKSKVTDKIGKRVRITGTLFEGITGHHHTPVLIELHGIEVIDKYSWR